MTIASRTTTLFTTALTGAALALGACGGHTVSAGPTGVAPIDPIGTTPASTTASPWTSESQSIDVTCGGFMDGAMRFRADRAQLSAHQLDVLATLATTTPAQTCGEDGLSCSVAITQKSGAVARYAATDCGDASQTIISAASFEPFRQTLECRYSKSDLGAAPGDPAAAVPADARCYDGMFTGGSGTIRVALAVDAAGPRHIELDDCNGPNQAGKVTAAVLSPTAGAAPIPMTVVGPANAGAAGTCATLDTTLPAAGTYTLEVTIADGFLPAGDFWLRYY